MRLAASLGFIALPLLLVGCGVGRGLEAPAAQPSPRAPIVVVSSASSASTSRPTPVLATTTPVARRGSTTPTERDVRGATLAQVSVGTSGDRARVAPLAGSAPVAVGAPQPAQAATAQPTVRPERPPRAGPRIIGPALPGRSGVDRASGPGAASGFARPDSIIPTPDFRLGPIDRRPTPSPVDEPIDEEDILAEDPIEESDLLNEDDLLEDDEFLDAEP